MDPCILALRARKNGKALFNKPKRNIRRRLDDEDDYDQNSGDKDDDSQNIKIKSSHKKKDKPKQTLLSFGEEFEEADDGEVFRVKKSSRSKKLMKQLDQERKRKKGEEKMQLDSESSNMSYKQEKDLEIKTDDLVVKIKNTGPLILNGRDALVVGKDDYTSEDEPEDSHIHRFSKKSERSENMKFLLESGCIPDAAMIHAARKKRQKARELGSDFIPVEEQGDDKGPNRLIREEDHDRSDDDSQDRIDMTVNTDARDKEKRRQAFLDSQMLLKSDNESANEFEEQEWEYQQIRKGVTGTQIAVAQQDSIMPYNNSGIGYNHYASTSSALGLSTMMPNPPPPPNIQPPDPTTFVPVTAEEILNKLRERLLNLRNVHERHESNCDLMKQELEQSKKELEQGLVRAPEMAKRFRYYQELRGYVTDLVECLDEKVPLINALEQRWLTLYGDRAKELIERRRQDTRDQADEIAIASRATQIIRRGPEDTARMRRATEREGRRARRRRAREQASTLSRHMDGMSSDDEVTEQQNLIFKQTREEIENDSQEVFADALNEFCTVKGILTKFEGWRVTDLDTYSEAYVPLCIPKILSPLIRLHILLWNPLMESLELEKTKWYSSLVTYALNPTETEESLRRDPDVRLIPLVIEKVVIPKLKSIVEAIWDPMSTSQTLRLIGIINRLIRDYPNLNETSKQLQELFSAVLDKINSAVDNDVFIPIFQKQFLDPKHQFFQRQFSMSIKLLRNLLSWQGLLGDLKLKNIALSSLLNRYILAGLRIVSPTDAILKANMIVSTLPRVWLQKGDNFEHLKMFTNLVQHLADQLDQANPAHNEAWECSKTILNKLAKSM